MTLTTTPEVEAYLAAVREALADLPEAERDDLLRDVEPSLVDAAAEDEGPLAARLGPPEEFAAELRASAGLPAAPAGQPTLGVPSLVDRLRALASSSRVASIGSALRTLAPIWWLLRGYVAVVVVLRLAGAGWSTRYPVIPRPGGSGRGLALVVLGVLVSLACGLAGRRRRLAPAWLVVSLNVLLAVAAVPALWHLRDALRTQAPVVVEQASSPVVQAAQPVVGSAVESVKATRGRVTHVEATIADTGAVRLPHLAVQLTVDHRPTVLRLVSLLPGRSRQVRFAVRLTRKPTTHVVQVRALPVPGERNVANNSATVRVRATR